MHVVHKAPTDELLALSDLALADPVAAIETCGKVLEDPLGADRRAVVLRARGLAHRLLGNLEQSALDLNEAMRLGHESGDDSIVAGVAITLAGTRVFQGRMPDAIKLLESAIATSTGELKAEAIFQLGTTNAQAGDLDQALEHYKRALPLLRRYGRRDWESNLLGNRGIMHFHLGDFAASVRDLDDAIDLQRALGIPAQVAINMLNKAQVLYMSGDVASSLDLYDEAEQMHDDLGIPIQLHAQKCETYLATGLFDKCLVLAQASHQFNRKGQLTIGQIRSLLPGADAALALGQHDLAVQLAGAVAEVPGADSYPAWIARADLIRLEAALTAGNVQRDDIQSALAIHRETMRTDSGTAMRAVLVAAAIAVHLDHADQAVRLLDQSSAAARRAPLHLQVQRWSVVAQARSNASNDRGALSAVRAGLRAFSRFVAGVTSYDVRARANHHVQALTAVGAQILIGRNRPADAAELIGTFRSSSLSAPHRATGQTRELIAAEAKLRSADGDGGTSLAQLQSRLLVQRGDTPSSGLRPEADETMLTWVEIDSTLFCIHLTNNDAAIAKVGAMAEVRAVIADHELLHRQLARRSSLTAASVASLLKQQRETDSRLSELLLNTPLPLNGRVVLSPDSALQGVVWGALPSLRLVPHMVAPSLAVARRGLKRPLRAAAVIGDHRLAHVDKELADVAREYGPRTKRPSFAQLTGAADGVDVLHLAGHFVAHGSDPLMSGIELADGTFRGLDYLTLERPPIITVLSACASASSDPVAGAAVGFATAALAAGTPCVIATQTIVEDSAAFAARMRQLHQLMRVGMAPADALVRLREDAGPGDLVTTPLVAIGNGTNPFVSP